MCQAGLCCSVYGTANLRAMDNEIILGAWLPLAFEIFESTMSKRTVFFVSDGTGITAETFGQSLLTQFEGLPTRQTRMPFIDSLDKAEAEIAKQSFSPEGARLNKKLVRYIADQPPAEPLHGADQLGVVVAFGALEHLVAGEHHVDRAAAATGEVVVVDHRNVLGIKFFACLFDRF